MVEGAAQGDIVPLTQFCVRSEAKEAYPCGACQAQCGAPEAARGIGYIRHGSIRPMRSDGNLPGFSGLSIHTRILVHGRHQPVRLMSSYRPHHLHNRRGGMS